MGEETWKYADTVASMVSERRQLYLASNGEANDVYQSGSLTEAPVTDSPPDQFTYDPLDIRPGELEREEMKNYHTDQTSDLNLFGNGLVYHSTPLSEATEITGWVKMVVWLELNVPDTDFRVELSEVLANGDVIRLTSDLLRARYRQSLREEKLVVPGEINQYTFDGFTFFSRRIAKRSRLRLVIACPNSIYMQKNYNAGGDVSKETAEEAKTARITLYHDADHPSYLELPIANDETKPTVASSS
jgi:putative CocE/NonD family hydrolase